MEIFCQRDLSTPELQEFMLTEDGDVDEAVIRWRVPAIDGNVHEQGCRNRKEPSCSGKDRI